MPVFPCQTTDERQDKTEASNAAQDTTFCLIKYRGSSDSNKPKEMEVRHSQKPVLTKHPPGAGPRTAGRAARPVPCCHSRNSQPVGGPSCQDSCQRCMNRAALAKVYLHKAVVLLRLCSLCRFSVDRLR